MSRYIDAEKIEWHTLYFNGGKQEIAYKDEIDAVPTEDVDPVVDVKTKGFIEVTRKTGDFVEKVLVNVKHIDCVFTLPKSTLLNKTRISFSSEDGYIDVIESYEEVKKMIEEAL